MANIVIKPASGTLEFNTGVVAGSAVDTTLSGASRLTFDSGELNLVSYATGNLNRFTIDGSTSRLFSAYDQMSGSLMSINTIAGFPVFEAFSDNTIVLGKYGSKDFVSTGNKIGIGTAAPANKLEVFGTGDISVRITTTGSAAATDFAALRFFQGGTQKGSVIANSGVLRIGAGGGIGATSGVYVTSVGNVGIGTSSPSQLLDITGAFTSWGGWVLGGSPGGPIGIGAGSSSATRYIGAGASTTNFYHNVPVGGTFRFNIAESEKVRIDTNGNVGIGTGTPVYKLHIVDSSAATALYVQSSVAGLDPVIIMRRVGALGGTAIGADNVMFGSSVDALIFPYNDAGRLGGVAMYYTNGSTKTFAMGINNAGNVGIGTTSPQTLLHVTGSVANAFIIERSTANSNINMQFKNATASWYAGQTDLGTFGIGTAPALGSSSIFNITTGGNVGIGTTTPSGKLEAYGTGNISVRITTTGNDATTDFAALRFFQGGSQKGSVIANNSVLRLSAGTNLSGIFISDSGNIGINSIPTGTNNVRFQVNGGVGSGVAALRFENCGISGAGSVGIGEKTFSEWLPIQIDSTTTRYIPLYT